MTREPFDIDAYYKKLDEKYEAIFDMDGMKKFLEIDKANLIIDDLNKVSEELIKCLDKIDTNTKEFEKRITREMKGEMLEESENSSEKNKELIEEIKDYKNRLKEMIEGLKNIKEKTEQFLKYFFIF